MKNELSRSPLIGWWHQTDRSIWFLIRYEQREKGPVGQILPTSPCLLPQSGTRLRGQFSFKRLVCKLSKCADSSVRSLPVQVVDLRWGVRGVDGDHEDCEIFLEEIRKCRQTSAGPSFIVSFWFVFAGHVIKNLPASLKSKLMVQISPQTVFFFDQVSLQFWCLKLLISHRWRCCCSPAPPSPPKSEMTHFWTLFFDTWSNRLQVLRARSEGFRSLISSTVSCEHWWGNTLWYLLHTWVGQS